MAAKSTIKPRPKTKSKASSQPLSRLQLNMRKLQNDAEKLIKQTSRQATQLIGRDQRKALDRLLSQADKVRKDLEKRIQKATSDIEKRTKQVISGVEKQTTDRVNGLLKRLDVPSRREIQNLARRVGDLEKKIRTRAATPKPVAVSKPAPPPPPVIPPPTPDLPF